VFGPDNFMIQSLGSVSVLVVHDLNRPNNPKFNIISYFDSNYDVTTLLFYEFFHELVSYLL
jgi:hypothetical protein